MSATAEHHASSVASTNIQVDAAVNLSARQRLALRDLSDGSRLWRLAVTLGWLDIKLRYRGSVIGPFWLTLSTAVQIGAMGAVYGTLFHQDLHDYLPFLAVSLVMWSAVTSISADACTTFLQADATIRSMRMPYFVHVMRVQVRTVLTLAHNLPVLLVVGLIYHAWPGIYCIAAVPALLLWLVDGVAACMLLGAFCARFRDVPPIVSSIMQIAFFITPIVWKAGPAWARWLVAALQPVLRPAGDRPRPDARPSRQSHNLGVGAGVQRGTQRRRLDPVRPGARPHRVLDLSRAPAWLASRSATCRWISRSIMAARAV